MPEFNPTNLPYVKSKDSDSSDNTAIGGRCIEIGCAAALKLGEYVVLTDEDEVNKSKTATDAVKRIGVVVGGDLTGMRAISTKDQYGVLTVTSAAGRALVQISGVTYTIADAEISAVGQLTIGTTTEGRVAAAALVSATIDDTTITVAGTQPGAVFGVNLEKAAAAGDLMLTLLR